MGFILYNVASFTKAISFIIKCNSKWIVKIVYMTFHKSMAFWSPNITGRNYRKRCKNIFSTILLFFLAHMKPRAVTFFEWSWYILYNGKCFAKSNAFKQWRVSFSHIMIICKIHNVVLWVEQYPLWILIVVHVRRVDDAARFTSCNFLRLMITISLYHSITVNNDDVARIF